jgi:geranylgeranyl diphosphate synthase type I
VGSSPPAELTDVADLIDERLERLFAEQGKHWHRQDSRLAEAVDELGAVVTSGGKRLRAAFCYWSWRGARTTRHPDQKAGTGVTAGLANVADPAPPAVIDAASAFELLQAFALIHDDIMDDSATRRGRPTVHMVQAERLVAEGWRGEPRRFGEGVAILIGDLSHAYADSLMSGVDPAARKIWDELRIELNLGQYLDLRSAAAGQLDTGTAHQVSTFKSALYTIVRPLQLGASLDGPADPELLDRLDRFGRPLGRAFQLKDDLLGVLGDEHEIGKPVGDDLREGKPTELMAVALDRASPVERTVLAGIGRRDLGADEVAGIVDVLIATGAVDEITARISGGVAESVAVVADLPFDPQAKAALRALADYVATRTS